MANISKTPGTKRKKEMKQVNTHYFKTHFSKLYQEMLKGEEIVICRYRKPIARLVPFEKNVTLEDWEPTISQMLLRDKD